MDTVREAYGYLICRSVSVIGEESLKQASEKLLGRRRIVAESCPAEANGLLFPVPVTYQYREETESRFCDDNLSDIWWTYIFLLGHSWLVLILAQEKASKVC